jgi:hypothetical protein
LPVVNKTVFSWQLARSLAVGVSKGTARRYSSFADN